MNLKVVTIEAKPYNGFWTGHIRCQHDSDLGVLAMLQDLQSSDDFKLESWDLELLINSQFVNITLRLPHSLQATLEFSDHYGADLVSSWCGVVAAIIEESAHWVGFDGQGISVGLDEPAPDTDLVTTA